MPIGLSTSYYATHGKSIYASVKRISEAGFDYAELGAAHEYEDNARETLKRIKKDFPDLKYTLHGLFPPQREKFWFNACEGLTTKNMDAVDNLFKAADIIEPDVVSVHPGYPTKLKHSGKTWGTPKQGEEIDLKAAVENSKEVIEFGLIAAEDRGIKFAIENAGLSPPHNLFLMPSAIKTMLDVYPDLGFLLDIGHAMYMGKMQGMLEFHERVVEMHVHYSHLHNEVSPTAACDEHLPLPSDFDFTPLKKIKQIGEIPLIFEHIKRDSEEDVLAEKKLVEGFLNSL